MYRALLLVGTIGLVAAGCGDGSSRGRLGGTHGGGAGSGGGVAGNIPGCDPADSPAGGDQDHDGYTPSSGDCNDCNPTINPGAIQIPGDSTDYACNGQPGVVVSCDTTLTGKRDATSLAQAFEQCDPRFFQSATLVGPSDQRGRKVEGHYGVLMPRAGLTMALLSTGIAADKSDPAFNASVKEDPGTSFGEANTWPNPLPDLPGVAGCSQVQPVEVNDYVELVVRLKAPTNVNSYSFDFQFFSAEYPGYVCTQFNDEFLVLQESKNEFQQPTNIAFDMQKNPVTVNNGFFTVCQNDPSNAHAQNCLHPLSEIAGTGFEDMPLPFVDPLLGTIPPKTNIPGGSTGWLTTTAPVTPGEDVVLHFIIFDEGDHILDSAALIDNFRWGTSVVQTPSTSPIM